MFRIRTYPRPTWLGAALILFLANPRANQIDYHGTHRFFAELNDAVKSFERWKISRGGGIIWLLADTNKAFYAPVDALRFFPYRHL